ncbi:MAG: efflux RND transporter periplasmic adaptor subunit, partial [Isosphaeraceae bacterium]
VALDETQSRLDQVEEKRERNLLARKAASQEDYDRARAKADKSAAQVDSSKASLSQAMADYDINILAAQAKVDQAKADLEAAQIDLGYCRMASPIDGRIGELRVKLGNLVGPATGSIDTTELVTIRQLDPMGVDLRPASLYLPYLTRLVERKLPFTLKIQGQRTHPHEGRLTFVDNSVDPTTSTVLVKGELPNPDQTILPGEYVKVELNVGDYADVIVVPEQAVVETQEGFRVLIVDDKDQVRESVVKTLDTYQGLAVLESGVSEGQRVIVEGIQLVRPGQSVLATEADLKRYEQPAARTEESSPLDSPTIRIRGAEPTRALRPAAGTPADKTPAPASAKHQPRPSGRS